MKIIFSESKPDYAHYLFPYAIWALPDKDESPSDIFAKGFLPSSRDMDRYYLCRQVRIQLDQFTASSENRRILRKGQGIRYEVIPRDSFELTEERIQSWLHYANIKFGKNIMTRERLHDLLHSKLISHLMVFYDKDQAREVGTATLFLESPRMAFYYYAFYDLNYYERNLGMYMMTSAISHFAEERFDHLYLGSVYSQNALYKTQFQGASFFNGLEWTQDFKQLKFLLKRDQAPQTQHLLESEDFLKQFYPNGLPH